MSEAARGASPPPPVAIAPEAIELVRVSLPLVRPFETSFGAQRERDVLLLRVLGEDAEGWAECVATAWPMYTEEYVGGAAAVIEEVLAPRVLGAGPLDAPGLLRLLAPVRGHRMAKAALETAFLDAGLRVDGVSLAAHLGATSARIAPGVSVGIAPSLEALVEEVGGYVAQGYRRVKLKVKPGWDVAPVAAVRAAFGDELLLQVDANTAYDPDDPAALASVEALDDFGLLLIEQPFAADELWAHAQLQARLRTAVCLDESITCFAAARTAIELGACRVVNVKPGRVGGLLEARRIHDLARAQGISLFCGGMLETGLGRAALLALAALPGFDLPPDISATDRYYARDITPPFTLVDGAIEVPTGPGVGVVPDPDALAALGTGRRLLRA